MKRFQFLLVLAVLASGGAMATSIIGFNINTQEMLPGNDALVSQYKPQQQKRDAGGWLKPVTSSNHHHGHTISLSDSLGSVISAVTSALPTDAKAPTAALLFGTLLLGFTLVSGDGTNDKQR